ncbi:unnamed protein product [Mortierella alpina]
MATTQAKLLFTPDKLKELQDLFNKHDADKDGRINSEELLQLIKSADQTAPSNEIEIEKTIASFDTDGDGQLNFEEFMSIMTHLKAL